MKKLKRTRNFTLIELLIVVAIIAILAGMLLPALASVREKARSVQCSSQQKQLAMAHIAYTDDNKSYFAPNCANNSLPEGFRSLYRSCEIKLEAGKHRFRKVSGKDIYPYICLQSGSPGILLPTAIPCGVICTMEAA